VDVTVNIGRKLSLEKTHSICQEIEDQIRKKISESDINIHIKPLPLDNETIVERVSDCGGKQ